MSFVKLPFGLAAACALVLTSSCGGGSPSAPPASAGAGPEPSPVLTPPPQPPTVAPDASESASPPGSPATQPPAGKAPSRTEARTFDAPSLGVRKTYQVYLPRGYDDSQRRFPVVVMLHGLGGNERNWLENGELARVADVASFPAIVVMPDGDASFYVDRATQPSFEDCMKSKPTFNPGEQPATFCVKTPRYASYITGDLLRDVDSTYRTIPRREARGIGGLSMGGFGALQLALRHQDRFSIVAAHSALASLLYTGPRPFEAGKAALAASPSDWGKGYPSNVRDHVRAVMGPSIETWKQHDPATLAQGLAPGRLAIWIDCGTEDEYGFADHARHLHDVLARRSVEHGFELAPGRHDFTYWKARLPKSLAFFASRLARD